MLSKLASKTIFLDMDGVLSDFVYGACQVHGVEIEAVLDRQNGHDDLTRAISPIMSEREFWLPIQGSSVFWSTLPVMRWKNDLMVLLEETGAKWFILSCPGKKYLTDGTETTCESSVLGKLHWLRRHFGSDFKNYIPVPNNCKHLLANPSAVLIDDREKNAVDFCKHGGEAVLFPTPTCLDLALRKSAVDPVKHVRNQLENIACAIM